MEGELPLDQEGEEILRLGREHPLSRDEALRMMTAVVRAVQEGQTRRRGKVPEGLEGDPEEIAARIVAKGDRLREPSRPTSDP